MANATGGKKYDFKRSNIPGTQEEKLADSRYNDPENHYRGMPILGTMNGKAVFASARDVGNIGAGLIAGRNGLSWIEARAGLDAVQKIQECSWSAQETSSTQMGERLGYRVGLQLIYNSSLFDNELMRLTRLKLNYTGMGILTDTEFKDQPYHS